MNERVAPYVYKELARSGHLWKYHSEAFKFTAETLYEAAHISEYGIRTDVKTHDIITYLFLIGLSLETLLKGLIVEADPTLIRDVPVPRCTSDLPSYRLERSLKTHELSRLAKLAEKTTQRDLSIDSEARELLERLTFFVIWEGRYPVAIKSKDQQSYYFRSIDDRKVFERLWERLSTALEEVAEKRRQQQS